MTTFVTALTLALLLVAIGLSIACLRKRAWRIGWAALTAVSVVLIARQLATLLGACAGAESLLVEHVFLFFSMALLAIVFLLGPAASRFVRARNEQAASEARYRSMFDNARVGIYQTTPDGRILMANPALVRMLGHASFDELAARNVESDGCTLDLDRAEFRRLAERPGGVQGLEVRWLRRDGSTIRVRENAFAVRAEDGRVLYYEGIVEDVTAWKAAEDELNSTSAMLRSVIDAAPIAVVAVDSRGMVSLCNPAAERLFRAPASEIVGRPLDVVPEDEAVTAAANMKRVLAGETLHDLSGRRRRRDGTLADVLYSAAPVRGADGRIEGVLALISDDTARRQAEEALRRSEDRYRTLVEAFPDGIALHRDGKILFANPAAARLLRVSDPDKLVGTDVMSWVDPSCHDVVSRRVQAQRSGQAVPLLEETFVRADGTRFPAEVIGNPVPFADGVALQVVFRDVTRRKELEQQLQQAMKMEALGRLAGGVAHDFNNLLTAIIGYTSLLIEQLPADSPYGGAVREILSAGERASALTGQLLVFSRRKTIETRLVELNAIVTGMGTLLRRIIGEHIELVTRLDPAAGSVRVDPGHIEQAIVNLSVNSRDAMPDGGRLVIETARVDLDEPFQAGSASVAPGLYVQLSVTDTGCGMAADVRSHLFEPFFTTKEPGKGTGLGLASVYGVVKQAGGTIWIYSEPGKGTTVKILLPSVDEAGELAPSVAAKDPPAGGSEAILLVEDEDTVRTFAATVLLRLGYRVLVASNGIEASALADGIDGGIDLLVTDVVMPGMSGRDLVARLAATRPTLPVLYISGYTDAMIDSNDLMREGTSYLQKPFTPRQLAGKVRESLERARERGVRAPA